MATTEEDAFVDASSAIKAYIEVMKVSDERAEEVYESVIDELIAGTEPR